MPSWEESENSCISASTPEELARLPLLYRSVLSSLSVARSISLDQNVVEYLEGLAGRGYVCVYGTRTRMTAAIVDFFRARFNVFEVRSA